MALGVTNIIKPATVDLTDIEVLYSYTADRISKPTSFIKVETTSDIIEQRFINETSKTLLQGMYLLKLNAQVFNSVGFYTLIIRPKQITTTILDCGILSQLPDQKGIVLDTNQEAIAQLGSKLGPGGLCGFRIEYLNDDGSIINNLFTTVSYSNRCEALTQVANTTTQKSVVYRFNDVGSLLYLSVTPSTSPSVKPNAFPYIGVAGQQIIISNTYFDQQVIDIELSEYDLKKIALLVNGERTLNVETGIENIYDDSRNILAQSTLYDIKDEFQNPLYKVKQNNTEINESETWNSINQGVENV
jgi:hypothetical protein